MASQQPTAQVSTQEEELFRFAARASLDRTDARSVIAHCKHGGLGIVQTADLLEEIFAKSGLSEVMTIPPERSSFPMC